MAVNASIAAASADRFGATSVWVPPSCARWKRRSPPLDFPPSRSSTQGFGVRAGRRSRCPAQPSVAALPGPRSSPTPRACFVPRNPGPGTWGCYDRSDLPALAADRACALEAFRLVAPAPRSPLVRHLLRRCPGSQRASVSRLPQTRPLRRCRLGSCREAWHVVPDRSNASLMPTRPCGCTLCARPAASAARACGIAHGR